MSFNVASTSALDKPLARAKRIRVTPTGVESPFYDHEIIVSKTDPNGKITYANDIFQRVSGFSLNELMGAPHSIIRHPEMPRAVFHYLWEELQQGREVFSYVVNLCANGNHYWVFAHMTPTWDSNGKIIGYHSTRRTAKRSALPKVKKIYGALLETEHDIERNGSAKSEAIRVSREQLNRYLTKQGVTYDELIWSL